MTTIIATASATGAKGLPKTAFRVWRGGQARKGIVHYLDSEHGQFPHIVKFSGGRSSGMMLLMLLESEVLSAHRGDVVLFTNTSAEHPATYDFVRKMKRASEQAGIPFLLAEQQTIETVVDGMWSRQKTYRLVNDEPLSATNPQGYSHRGEIFEEMIAEKGMLPSMHIRICTVEMKMRVTREFLSDWLAAAQCIPSQGHFRDAALVDPRQMYSRYVINGGTMTREDFDQRLQFLSKRPTYRQKQAFCDFTRAPIQTSPNPTVANSVFGGRADILGTYGAGFLTMLGFRNCEPERYMKMTRRNMGDATPGYTTHPPGEYSYAPLYSCGIRQDDVLAFWDRQPKRIKPLLPTTINLSNCVFCFLKGPRSIARIQHEKSKFESTLPDALRRECRKKGTPNSLSWWVRIEDTYARSAHTPSAKEGSLRTFGMFGLASQRYRDIRHKRLIPLKLVGADTKTRDYGDPAIDPSLTCECTD